MVTKGDRAEISVAEEHKEPTLAMSVKGFQLDKTEGTIGMGTNKQKAAFGMVKVEPIRLKKPELAVETAALKEMDVGGAPAAEISPAMVVDNGNVPNAALGNNGGMAPKKEGISQEQKLKIEDVVKNRSVDERKRFCGKHFPKKEQLEVCVAD